MTFIALLLTVITNFIFINYWGISGAALATALTYLIVNFIMFYFLYYKFKLQPFKVNNLVSMLVALIVYVLFFNIDLNNPWINIATKGILISLTYWMIVVKLSLSNDINAFLSKQPLIKKIVEVPKGNKI